MTAKLPRFANQGRPMTVGEFAYGHPATVGQCVTVSSDELKRLLDRVYELECVQLAVEAGMEEKIRFTATPDGGVAVSVEGA